MKGRKACSGVNCPEGGPCRREAKGRKAETTPDPYDVRVVVTVSCTFCDGTGRIRGGRYAVQGEVERCPVCRGRGRVKAERSLAELYDLEARRAR